MPGLLGAGFSGLGWGSWESGLRGWVEALLGVGRRGWEGGVGRFDGYGCLWGGEVCVEGVLREEYEKEKTVKVVSPPTPKKEGKGAQSFNKQIR